jgi:UDP-glucose 4-epimerase
MTKNISLITGGAGFIGVNLISALLKQGRHVVVVDNFSRGSPFFIESLYKDNFNQITVVEADCSMRKPVEHAFKLAQNLGNFDEVWHLAANSDIPAGVQNSDVDLKDTFLTTHEIIRAMKIFDVKHLHFASSSAIYGDFGSSLIYESNGPLMPISNYGAMKLASEALASAGAESNLDRINIFRFPNVVGVPATHGVILDFINKLLRSPKKLDVLGDGTQQKSYLHVSDLIDAMLVIRNVAPHAVREIVNIGPIDDGVTVNWIAEQVVSRVSPGAAIVFGVGNKGWVGDVPKFNYSTKKLQSYGWSPRLGSPEAVSRAIHEIALQLGK